MRWSATICWCRDEAYGMVHANEEVCNYLLVAEMKHMAWCMLMRMECNYLLVQR